MYKMTQPFSLKVKKKRVYGPGVLVIGKILSGEISYDEDVIVRIDSSLYSARVDAINTNYPNGENVDSCGSGTNVGLYLSKIDYNKIILGKTYIESEPNFENDEEIISQKKKVLKKEKPKKVQNKKKTSISKQEKSYSGLQSFDGSKENTANNSDLVAHVSKTNLSREESGNPHPSYRNSLTSAEKEFISDIKHCLKDQGRLSPSEIFVLDKIRAALSITKIRAKELISITKKEYSYKKNEVEYRDAVSICLMDSNYITLSERFLLERLRLSLNISEQIAYEIEKNCQWILTIEQ